MPSLNRTAVIVAGLVGLVVGVIGTIIVRRVMNGGAQTWFWTRDSFWTQESFWKIAGFVIVFGLVGGVINSLLSDSGFFLPGMYEVEGRLIFKPGALGNAFLGAAAAFISWGLYGPFSQYVIIPQATQSGLNLTVETLVGAIVAGSAGSRLITSAIGNRVLTEAAATAAGAGASAAEAASIATAPTPTEALRIARQMS
jgi:hypothetical protein